jgi:adenosylcobinamide-GDP ribazoletransferase
MGSESGNYGQEILAAVRFLTALPLPGPRRADGARLARAVLFFPVVGALIGGVLVAADRGTSTLLAAPRRDVLVVVVLGALSGGRHLRALAALAAGAGGRGGCPGVPRRGGAAFGIAAVAAVLVAKVIALAWTRDPVRADALLLAPVLGRWAFVVLAYGARPVRPSAVQPVPIGRVTFREFGWASVLGFAVALVRGEALGLVALVAAAGVTTALRVLVYRRRGGMTGDALGTGVELVEVSTLGIIALLSALGPVPAAALAAR